MADLPPYRDPSDDTCVGPGTPRWVKMFGIIVIVLVLLVVILMFIGGGRHGPGRHIPSGDAGGQRALSSVVVDDIPPEGNVRGHAPLEGGHG